MTLLVTIFACLSWTLVSLENTYLEYMEGLGERRVNKAVAAAL